MEVIQTNEDEQFIVEKKSEEIKDIPQSDSNPEPLLLSQTPIFFHHQPLETDLPKVPPPSLRELVTDCFVTILPTIPESLDQLDIPYVREHGVRDSIHLISDYFACQHYRNNLVQFWFLDILVDCIWKTQDEFRFQKNQQKIVLEWMMFIFKLITMDGMTKELMFDIFTEALMIAEEYIQSGGIKEPSPRNLFVLKEDPSLTETKSGESMLSTSGSALSLSNIPQSKQSNEYIIIKYDEAVQVFKIPNKTVMIQDCVSSIEPPSDDGYQITDITHESKDNLSETPTTESSIEFYKPDMSTPPRFKSLSSLLKEEEKEESIQKIENPKHTDKGEWVNIPRREIITDCPSKLLSHTSTGNNVHENGDPNGEIDSIMLDKEEVFKAFYKHNLWQLRNSFTNDSQIGWVPSIISKKEVPRQKRSNKHFDSSSNKNEENSIFINSCILLAVKEIIFDYFYSPFSFHLARYALKNPQFLITQDLNTEWHIPKDIKGDFKKPMPKKPKKEKKKKEKKEKKDKSSKKSKSTKSSKKDKKDKDKKSKDKKSKKSSEKKSKSSKKSDKSPKMTKEEKLELEQQKKEREELERQQFKEEEHRRFMFPLKEAVNDEFFAGIFPNYKPKRGKEVSKKTKDDKKSKKEKKSDKSSKKSKKK